MAGTLDEIKSLFRQSTLSRSDIFSILVQARILLEKDKQKSKYQTLNLYCNWTLHCKIEHSRICYIILGQLTDMLVQHDEGKPEVITEIDDILLIEKLRKEFIKFCNQFKLPTVHFTEEGNWASIYGIILYNLIDKPLEFPSMKEILKKASLSKKEESLKSMYAAIQNKSKGTGLAVKRFTLVLGDIPNTRDQPLCWDIEPSNKENVHIIGRFAFNGQPLLFH